MLPRILLADDHVVVRQGFKVLLERAGFEVIAEADNGQEAIRLAEKFHPDIAVLDVAMPILNGIDAARGIKDVSPRTNLILLTMYSQPHFVLESFRIGVRGYILKNRAADELLRAVQSVCKGETYVTPSLTNILVEQSLTGRDVSKSPLGDRERQVLQLVAEGKTTKEIADMLGISTKTAESHRANLMKKLELHDVAGLVRYAIREGLIQP